MRKTATACQLVVRVTGVVQILLGMLFWAGFASSLVPVHMLVGLLLVLGMWTIAVVGFPAGAHRGVSAFALVWGLVVVALGMTQESLLTGSLHVIVEVAHLGVGIAAMGLAETLATQIKERTQAPAAA